MLMDAVFSPRKQQLANQASPRGGAARKRSLFPSNSPQNNDLGLMSELYSDDSDVYSPPFASPSSSVTPGKDTYSPTKSRMQNAFKVANNLQFNEGFQSSPRKSRFKYVDKENTFDNMRHCKSSVKSNGKRFVNTDKFDDNFISLLPEIPPVNENLSIEFEMKSSNNFTTPKKSIKGVTYVRRSPRSALKTEETIKPISFYGKVAPILATNQTNRIQGMKCVFRPIQQSKAKAKLLFDEKPKRKRERSRSLDVVREAKKRKAIFSGVHHAIPKPAKHSPPQLLLKQESIREKAKKTTDLSRTPYGNKQIRNKKAEGWELRFTKPTRYDGSPNTGTKRKFFKTSVQDCSSSPGSSNGTASPPFVPQKRIKLLDTRKSYIEEKNNGRTDETWDLLDMIENNGKQQQDEPVDDILLSLEEDDEEEKKKEAEIQSLMNILEDSPTKTAAIDSLSNCTASLDLNDSSSESRCSRFSLEDDSKENQSSPSQRLSSIFSSSGKRVLSESNQMSSGKKKWHGLGRNQLQIDAGQKRYGACQCAECGMLYQVGEAEDEIQHTAFHNNLNTLRHPGWKNEKVVGIFGSDYVIMITEDDSKAWQKKAQDVLAFVDKSLGITSEETSTTMHNHKVYLYVSEKQIVGCMVASPVSRAYRMISSESDVDICSEESYPVRCGVSRMWTLFPHRRRGVATCLLDTLRRNFMYGYILKQEEVAFSIPTPDGKQFATKYMTSSNFFVYTGY